MMIDFHYLEERKEEFHENKEAKTGRKLSKVFIIIFIKRFESNFGL